MEQTGTQTGEGTGQGAGQQTASAGGGQSVATAPETVSREEHQRELDRYRNEVGQANKRLAELEKLIADRDEATKSEAEKLAAKAAKAEQLEPEVAALRAALTEEVEAQKGALPEAMQGLLPSGSPAEQLAWIRKAKEAAAKITPAGSQSTLPDASGRNPAGGAQQANDKRKIDDAMGTYRGLRGRELRG